MKEKLTHDELYEYYRETEADFFGIFKDSIGIDKPFIAVYTTGHTSGVKLTTDSVIYHSNYTPLPFFCISHLEIDDDIIQIDRETLSGIGYELLVLSDFTNEKDLISWIYEVNQAYVEREMQRKRSSVDH